MCGLVMQATIFTLVSMVLPWAEARDGKPNVVIFFTDDQGTLDVNCYGSEDLYTPNMDRLAKEGVRFTQAYSHTVCCPARAMLMTGRHPQRCNVGNWTQGNAKTKKNRNMHREEITIAEVLKEAGYKTGMFGKWHLGAHKDHAPEAQGFDEFFGLLGGFIDNYNHYFLHGEGFHDLYDGHDEVFMRGQYFPDLMTGRALEFIDRTKEDPFFLCVTFNIPHYPEQPDRKFDEMYKDMPMPRQAYAKMISTTDDLMGQVIQRLEKYQIADDTIFIFMSDNGHSPESYFISVEDHLSGLPNGLNYGAHGGGGNTGKWRGAKASLFEGGIRVPAIISYPKALPQGIVRDQAITAMDWLPTLVDLLDLKSPANPLDGASVLPLIHSPNAPTHYKTMHWAWQNIWAVRKGNWKLISHGNNSPSFLGNLNDPKPESKNYLNEKPEIASNLLEIHLNWFKSVQ